jgi:hypothetical protein
MHVMCAARRAAHAKRAAASGMDDAGCNTGTEIVRDTGLRTRGAQRRLQFLCHAELLLWRMRSRSWDLWPASRPRRCMTQSRDSLLREFAARVVTRMSHCFNVDRRRALANARGPVIRFGSGS